MNMEKKTIAKLILEVIKVILLALAGGSAAASLF